MKKDVIQKIVDSYRSMGGLNYHDVDHLPSRETVNIVLNAIKSVLFPGYFEASKLNEDNLPYIAGQKITEMADLLKEEILKSICWECKNYKQCVDRNDCAQKAETLTQSFLEAIPDLRELLLDDASAIFDGDPAAKSIPEVILAYPGFQAIIVHRVANYFHRQNLPLIPRLMSEIVHSETGIDIHPGATIGRRFVIDHGTGVVVGETSIIGENVKLYQGVTIGALSVSKDIQEKRHPTIEDHVTIYARTTILGGDTVIGKNSIIGGNVWLIQSVPQNSKVYLKDNMQYKLKTK